MASFGKKALGLCCALTLAVSLVPAAALAGEGESASVSSVSDEFEVLLDPQVVTAETTAAALYGVSTFSLDDQGKVALREGSYERWIDRVDVPQYALDFYQVLEEAVDNDGDRDYLITSKYFDGCNEGLVFQNSGNTYLTAATVQFDSEDAAYDGINEIRLNLYAVTAAFDRDHPEVFWLGNGVAFGILIQIDKATKKTMLTAGYLLSGTSGGAPFDVRSTLYRQLGAIEKGIELRENAVSAARGKLQATDDDAAKVSAFNKHLTWTNEYNTNMANAMANYPLAWESLSALLGRAGEEGPVCEGYARALKVLCDREKIPCVLVDGYANNGSHSEAHMWNYVKLGNSWYAVDTTWNDPTGGKSGATSGVETEKWLLVGGATLVNSYPFLQTHPVANSVYENQVTFTNGPRLSARSYAERLILPTLQTTATYGDVLADVALPGGAVADAKGVTVPGAWTWNGGSAVVRAVGTVTHEALFTPKGEDGELTPVSITVSPKTIAVVPGTVANKTYNGTTAATFSTQPTLSGVLRGDEVRLVATATFADAAAGNSKRVNIAYKLEGRDARNYTLAKTSDTATATIEAAPVVTPPPSTPSSDASTPGTSGSSASTPSPAPSAPAAPSNPPAPSAGTSTPSAGAAASPSTPAASAPTGKPAAPAPSAASSTSGTSAAAASNVSATAPTPFKASSLKKFAKPTAKSSKKKTLTVTWKKGATVKWAGKSYTPKKYLVQCSTDKKFKKGVKTATVKAAAKKAKLTTTFKKLKAKKTYYVRVRASYTIGGKTYWTPYGVSKKVKVK